MSDEKILIEYEQYRIQAESTKKNLELIEQNLAEFKIAKESLEEIRKKDVREILVPLGARSFIRAELSSPDNIIVNVGSGVAVEKSISKAIEDIEHDIKELEKARQDQLKLLNFLLSKLEELAPKVQEITSKNR